MIIKNLFFRIWQKITSSVCVAVYAFSLFASLILSITSFLPDVANALTVLPNDLSITKTLSGTVYPWAIVETIIDYNNSWPTALSGISISDVYSSWLTLDSIVSSAPDLTISPVTFNHDTIFRTLRRDNISLGTGMSGQIIIRYLVSMSLPENTDVFNSSNVGISCVLCQDPFTISNSGVSVGYVNPQPIPTPTPYDLGIVASQGFWNTYNSWDFFYITLDISNDNYVSGNVILQMKYKSFLMQFVDIFDSGGISFPPASVVSPNANAYLYPQYYYNNWDTSRVTRNGFNVPTSWTTQVTLRFKMINDYSVPVDVEFSIGIPDEYGIMSTIGETNVTNNDSSTPVQWPEYDLWITSTILTGDEGLLPWTYSASGTVTVRVAFGNSWVSRNNIIVMIEPNQDQYISYTWDHNYGLPGTWYDNTFLWPESWWFYRKNISLAAGETGYIDITLAMHECAVNDINSRISIIDNYETALQSTRPFDNTYITDRARETDISNNKSSASIPSDGLCNADPYYLDYVISPIIPSVTGNIIPGQIITYWVPFDIFWTYNIWFGSFALDMTYNTGLSFVWLAATGIKNNAGIIDKLSASHINTDLLLISQLGVWIDSELNYIYNNPGAYATWECWFTTFPTGTPVDQPLPIYPYILSLSWVIANMYVNSYSWYLSMWFDHISAHAAALIDTQVLMYSYSLNWSSDTPLYDVGEWFYACEYNKAYLDAISQGYTTGQSINIWNQIGTQARDQFAKKENVFQICWWNLSINVNKNICRVNQDIVSLWYNNSSNTNDDFETELNQTLHDAYAVNLSISGFRQLLTNRIIGFYDDSKPTARQYSIVSSGANWGTFCPDLNCVNSYDIDYGNTPNPYPYTYVHVWYDEYIQIQQNFDNNMILSWRRIERNSGYIESRIIANGPQDIFIDDFTTTGELLLNMNMGMSAIEPFLIWLNFLVNEIAIGSSLDVQASVWTNYICQPWPYSYDYSQTCTIPYSSYSYPDTYLLWWGNSWDDVIWDDNITWSSLIVSYREPYDLTITKVISQTGNILPNDIVEITTTICNNGTGRSDISLSEVFMQGMIFLGTTWASNLGVWYTLNPFTSRVVWNDVSLNNGECKLVITQYQASSFVISGAVLNFVAYAWNSWTVINGNSSGLALANVTWLVIAPDPTIYTPYGTKEIIKSTFYTGDSIIYRISYSNPWTLTGIMNLYDIYESGLIFSGILNNLQWLTNMYHDTTDRIIMWTGVVVEPGWSYSIDLEFTISTGKNVNDTIQNNFAYDMLFIPESYIADADKTNNSGRWVASYSLNILQGTVLDDANGDDLLWGDAPLSWVVVWLSQSSILIATTLTSSTGSYVFTGLLPWLYTLTFTAPSWYVTTRSFTGVINNGILDLNWVSINALFNGYSSSSTDNATLMRTTTWAFCGNNTVETWEVCDDGANNGLAWYCNNSCSWTSPVSLCGNGVLNGSEQCDDGNNTNGDACSASCQYEMPSCSLSVDSYQSLNPLAVTVNLTGFGFWTMQILSGLTYGDSNSESNLTLMQFVHSYNTNWPYTITATVANRINSGLTQTCSISVQGTFGGGGSDPYCGNNIREGTEECDGGLLCNSSCEIVIPVCTGTGCEVIHTVAPIDPPTTGSTKRILYVRDDVIIPKYIKILPHAGAF